jgi:GGDEF domain-containing protein
MPAGHTRQGGDGLASRVAQMTAGWARLLASKPPLVTFSDRRTVNRAMSFFWGAGGAVVLAAVPLGTAPGTYVLGVLVIGALALLIALAFRVGQDRLPAYLLTSVVAMGSLAVTALMWFDGSPNSLYSLFYVFAALYACYFFSLKAVILQVVLIALCAGVELAGHRPSTASGAQWLIIMGAVVVAGVWVRHLVGQVRRSANTDGLTGTANRLQLNAELPRVLARAARSGEPVTVAMLDLDKFKEFNDESGHLAGDRHLADTASAWRSQLRTSDLLVPRSYG